MVEWLVWVRREAATGFYVLCLNGRAGSGTGGPDWERPPHTLLSSPRPLWLIMEMRKDHPEDNTSFNPGTELNNTDATCAFKCLFDGVVLYSLGIQLSKFFFFFSFLNR